MNVTVQAHESESVEEHLFDAAFAHSPEDLPSLQEQLGWVAEIYLEAMSWMTAGS
jgi:hypothetical protein